MRSAGDLSDQLGGEVMQPKARALLFVTPLTMAWKKSFPIPALTIFDLKPLWNGSRSGAINPGTSSRTTADQARGAGSSGSPPLTAGPVDRIARRKQTLRRLIPEEVIRPKASQSVSSPTAPSRRSPPALGPLLRWCVQDGCLLRSGHLTLTSPSRRRTDAVYAPVGPPKRRLNDWRDCPAELGPPRPRIERIEPRRNPADR